MEFAYIIRGYYWNRADKVIWDECIILDKDRSEEILKELREGNKDFPDTKFIMMPVEIRE